MKIISKNDAELIEALCAVIDCGTTFTRLKLEDLLNNNESLTESKIKNCIEDMHKANEAALKIKKILE